MFMDVYDCNLSILSLLFAIGIRNMIKDVEHIFVLSSHRFELIQSHVIEFVEYVLCQGQDVNVSYISYTLSFYISPLL